MRLSVIDYGLSTSDNMGLPAQTLGPNAYEGSANANGWLDSGMQHASYTAQQDGALTLSWVLTGLVMLARNSRHAHQS
jgi:hypothetical protein